MQVRSRDDTVTKLATYAIQLSWSIITHQVHLTRQHAPTENFCTFMQAKRPLQASIVQQYLAAGASPSVSQNGATALLLSLGGKF